MLSFALWAMLAVGTLAGAGYSHYRYRVRNDRYYEWLFARNREERDGANIEGNTHCSRMIPVLALVVVGFLVPMSLVA